MLFRSGCVGLVGVGGVTLAAAVSVFRAPIGRERMRALSWHLFHTVQFNSCCNGVSKAWVLGVFVSEIWWESGLCRPGGHFCFMFQQCLTF